ncbi:hypothetical protein BU24DRAFT_460130 [Aaosphaeria arxii CBS 175.79]|uniref:Uncharacterized protein n=1 Tax=Aaosphaeria arxii CBS 175.79 TaxID=1450172 RepID=A0A6A5XWE9_9PLEO|nr:uncharacterized protein BU24DRAFT_460130 [Aaosphaeria arxii CBS 175.79]KAF2017031.1 hypothetical protein BU24DRAFT_460130 [Aaosphaeria arxii CBS 175.79]
MAGRILPVALAVICGVSIGVATFDGELKQQQRKRLEEEYKRDLAALKGDSASKGTDGSTSQPDQKSSQAPVIPENSQGKSRDLLGLWAWKTKGTSEAHVESSHAPNSTDDTTRR